MHISQLDNGALLTIMESAIEELRDGELVDEQEVSEVAERGLRAAALLAARTSFQSVMNERT